MRPGRHATRLLALAGLAALSALAPACAPPGFAPDTDFQVAEATIPDLRNALVSGRVTSAQLFDLYLARIRAYDDGGPALNAMISINPLAREQAASSGCGAGGRVACADPCTAFPS